MATIRVVMMTAAVLGSATPGLASAQEAKPSPMFSASQADADASSGEPRRIDDRIRSTLTMSGMAGMTGTSNLEAATQSEREKQRRASMTRGSYAEAVLLIRSGLVPPISQLDLPACADEYDKPGFDCQILWDHQKRERARSPNGAIPLPRPIMPPVIRR